MMHNNESDYQFWTWIVALILSIILLLMLSTGHGPNATCCFASSEQTTLGDVTPDTTIVTSATEFGFNASATDFAHTGDGSQLAWFQKTDVLKALLASGNGLQADGDSKRVTLSGSVETNALKTKVGADAQQFFGAEVLIDNQIVVKAADASTSAIREAPAPSNVPSAVEASPVVTEPVATVSPPPAAKLYFRTASSTLPSKTNETIAPILDWLKTHPESKAVISGFHDSVGSPEKNVELAKKRALATLDALKSAGVEESRIIPRPPMSTDGGADLAEARRVEVSIE
jgi:outer membrane protein OmpA-like peptidoglycan-associated protein